MRVLYVHILCALSFVTISLGDIRFHNPAQYPTGTKSTGICIADLNNDGFNDVAVASRLSNSVTVLYNDGEGVFNSSATFETGQHPRYVEGADFDGDGDIDLCTPDYYGMSTTILENDGEGNFSIHSQYDFFTPAFLWLDDLDGDGQIDIGMMHWDSKAKNPSDSNGLFTPMFGEGDGTFYVGDSASVGVQPRGAASADLNGDGLIDVVSADIKGMTISVVLGKTPRTWQNGSHINFSPGTPRYIALGDFDNDEDVDIAVLDKLGGHCWLLHNDGKANFELVETVEVFTSPHSMVVADMDEDGDLDYVISHVGSVTQLILYNDGTGGIESMQGVFITGGAAEIKLGDLNNDGMLDIATANVNASHPGSAVLLQRECLTCEGIQFNNREECYPVAEELEYATDSFTPVDIELEGESFSGNALDYVITSIPLHGQLCEPNGLIVSSVPYYLSTNQVQFFPENGLISTESFRYMVNDCLPSSESEVVIQVDYPYPDECNVALEVENGLINISTLQATNSPEPFDATQCSDSDIGSMQKDIWLKYVACENGTLTVDGCELLTFDSDLAMYEGDCCNLVQLGCNGDSTDCQGGASSLSIEVEVGNSYFIRIGGSIESSEGG